jgi:hypothetical protein
VLLVGDPSAAFTVVFGLLKRDDKEIGLFVLLLLPLLKTSKLLLLVVVVLRKEEEDKEEERTTRVTDDDEDARLAPTKGVVATVVMMVSRRPFVCEERKEKKEGLVSHSFFLTKGLRFLSILTTRRPPFLFSSSEKKKSFASKSSSSSWPEKMMMQSTQNDARIALRIAVAKTIQTMMKRVKRISALAAEWSLQKTSTNWTLLPRKLAANQISSSPTMMMTRPKERIMCF